METKELEKRIGQTCEAIDPRSKRKEFEPATIISASFTASRINETEIFKHISFGVVLHKVTVRKGNRWREKREYHRAVCVSGPNIRFSDTSICPYCGGTGANPDLFSEIGACITCGGSGYLS